MAYGVIEYNEEGQPMCEICGKHFNRVAVHVKQKHQISEREYKLQFGFNLTKGICSKESAERSRERVFENYDKCNNNAFNVGLTAANCTKLELAETIQKYVPDLVIVQNNFKQDFDQRNYMVSNAKLESKGWMPIFTLEDGIQELIKGYQLIKKFKDKDFTNL